MKLFEVMVGLVRRKDDFQDVFSKEFHHLSKHGQVSVWKDT